MRLYSVDEHSFHSVSSFHSLSIWQPAAPGRYIQLPQTLLGPCTDSLFLTTVVVSISGQASDPSCVSHPLPLGTLDWDQLSNSVFGWLFLRIWEQTFHQHMMKATIHNEKKKKICQRQGTAKSHFQSFLRPYHITVLRVNPSFLVIKSLFLFKLVQVRFLLLITKRADPRMFRCHLENHLCYANIL